MNDIETNRLTQIDIQQATDERSENTLKTKVVDHQPCVALGSLSVTACGLVIDESEESEAEWQDY